jgi:hypothetical protein
MPRRGRRDWTMEGTLTDFIFYAARYVLEAGLGFGALFAVSTVMVHWRESQVRRHRGY